MDEIRILAFDIDGLTADTISKHCTTRPIDGKDSVISYMKSGHKKWFTTACVQDIVTEQETDIPDTGFTDGEYLWYAAEIYHFEKYNLKLNDDFIAHVLSKTGE